MQRLFTPGAINQFSHTLQKDQATKLFTLLSKYVPETKKEKRQRLKEEAAKKNENKEENTQKPVVVKFGLNHVTTLVEEKQAKLVVIAHDVEPIELMVFLPSLCRKMDVPYCFVKGKARLGKFVHQKTTTCLAITDVRREDQHDLDMLRNFFKVSYNDNTGIRTLAGEPVMGIKHQHRRGRSVKKQKAAPAAAAVATGN